MSVASNRRLVAPALLRPSVAGPIVALGVALALVLVPARAARATWSIVAVDPETGLVGGALASCVPASVLGDPDRALVPLVLVPGQAAAVTQGTVNPSAPPELRRLLADGAEAAQAIDLLLEDDEQPTARQYAVVVIAPPGAAEHTGDDAEGPAAVAAAEDATASAQGVLLADQGIADAALGAYLDARADGRSFDRALADALVAGSEAGGDRRCAEDQTALFAHLAVAEPDDDPVQPSLLLTVTVDEGDGQNPVALLDGLLDEGTLGWVDAGLSDPPGVPRAAVFVVATLLGVAAVLVIRRGMGTPSARR